MGAMVPTGALAACAVPVPMTAHNVGEADADPTERFITHTLSTTETRRRGAKNVEPECPVFRKGKPCPPRKRTM